MGLDESAVTITKIDITSGRRLADGGRRLEQNRGLKVSYEVVIPSSVSTSLDDLAATLTANKVGFATAFETGFVAAYEQNTGVKPVITGVTVSDAVGETVTVAPAATKAPATKAPEATATPGPTTGAPAKEEEEESDNGAMIGGVVGGIVGVGVLGACAYMYKKKNAQE